MTNLTTYYVIDRHNDRHKVAGPYTCKIKAKNKRNSLDKQYGAYRYAVSDNSGFILT